MLSVFINEYAISPMAVKGRFFMDITLVISQMCVMLIIILIGYVMFHKNKLNGVSSSHISGLVVNICNPATILCSAFDKKEAITISELMGALSVTVLAYAALMLAGMVVPRLLRIKQEDRYMYHFLTVYGNVGFLGIPLVSAVLGGNALAYVSINCVVYNLLFYTAGVSLIKKRAGEKSAAGIKEFLVKTVNIGTVSSLLTILLYLVDFDLPAVILDTVTYAGRATTFLSMIVLGVSVARIPVRELFCHKKDYLFIALRMLLLPICGVLLLKLFVKDPLLLGTLALLLAVPSGNLPLMCSREHGLSADALARIIVLTTLVSVVTIPVVVLFL